MAQMKYRVASVVSALTLATVSAIGLAGPANASPSGYTLDGTNPSTAAGGYCVNGSYAIYSKPMKATNGQTVGTIEVRYSPSCGTNWVRVNNLTHVTYALKSIQRKSSPTYWETESDSGAGWSYSMQIYAPGSTCIYVGASLVGNPGSGLGIVSYYPETNLC